MSNSYFYDNNMILCNIMYFGFVGMIAAVEISKTPTNTLDLFILSSLCIGTGNRTVNLLTHDDMTLFDC